ncbi:unnamed protein product [Microthlaspi erraticum]|uniref:Reverse transcriptase Ty1/copia-type domain-containing protein n=1 Tax=Microthlaspi erraticum TaxID=1685480 RepID=A0A6D2HIC8_9BRAS|nr:unnamed protein product [Microthlaspi erraticum]
MSSNRWVLKSKEEGKVYKLNKALYGLRQAPRAWNHKLNQILMELRFKSVQRSHRFTGRLTYYLGWRFCNDDGIISQKRYAQKIVEEAEMQNCNAEECGLSSILLHTRPDLSYCVGVLSRYMQNPKESHGAAMRQCLRTEAARQAIWLQDLLGEITGRPCERVVIRIDNQSAIALTRNPVFHGRSKHIHTRYHFIRECVENGQVEVEHVPGEKQKADILTKALGRIKFKEMRDLIGMKDLAGNEFKLKGENVELSLKKA